MAQWILVFTPPDVRAPDVARLLSARPEIRLSLSRDGEVLDVQREGERVELVQETAAIEEYGREELALVVAAIPQPNVFRVSYYRGTGLLSEVLGTISGLGDQAFVDNDYGVLTRLDTALSDGLSRFLSARAGRFSGTGHHEP